MKQETIEKIYAGLLGMDAGMRLGAPVENPYWTYERLRDYYGDMRGYLREYKNYAADDDVNGPVIFVRALGTTPEPESSRRRWWGRLGSTTPAGAGGCSGGAGRTCPRSTGRI